MADPSKEVPGAAAMERQPSTRDSADDQRRRIQRVREDACEMTELRVRENTEDELSPSSVFHGDKPEPEMVNVDGSHTEEISLPNPSSDENHGNQPETGGNRSRIVLSKKDEEWIKSNIRQRIQANNICHKKRESDSGNEDDCNRCSKLWKEHAQTDDDFRTGTTACNIYGNLTFDGRLTDCKYIRMDVDTDMSLVRHLLLQIWKVPQPSWMIAIMGEEDKEIPFQKKLKEFIETSFSDNEAVWITSEGLSVGLSGRTGETMSSFQKRLVHLGVNDMDSYTSKYQSDIKLGKSIPDKTPSDIDEVNIPSKHCKFHIFVDGGKYSNTAPQVDQFFRINLEKMISQFAEETTSIPYVAILYGGWHYIIDGVKKALDENIPIIAIKGSGGFADFLIGIYQDDSTKKVVYTEGKRKWTRTVLTEGHAKYQSDMLELWNKGTTEEKDKITNREGERLMLDCLKKRELITVFSCDNDNSDHEYSLLYAVFVALLKTKSPTEKTRLVDYYMSEKATWGSLSAPPLEKQRLLNLLIWHLLTSDDAQTIQYILEERGLNFVKFLNDMKEEDMPTLNQDRISDIKLELDGDAYKFLFDWAVKTNKVKCAAYFWKKGEKLLTSALKLSSTFHHQIKDVDNDLPQDCLNHNQLQDFGSLFKRRAIDFIDQCYKENKEMTMKIMASQREKDDPDDDHLSLALQKCNRQIFGKEAYYEYVKLIWEGRKQQGREVSSTTKECCTQMFKSPRSKYVVAFIQYVLFLALFGYTLLLKLQPRLTAWEITMAVWWFAFLIEEIRQFYSEDVKEQSFRTKMWMKAKKHFDNKWNVLDAACLLCFLLGLILMIPVYVDPGKVKVYTAAKFFFGLAWMLFTLRSLQFLAMINFFAPLLEMIYRMLKDLLPFIGILLVFILAVGLAIRSVVYSDCQITFEIIFDIFKNPFWTSFGEFYFDDVEKDKALQKRCYSDPAHLFSNQTSTDMAEYGVPIFLSIFAVLTNLLLINVIIAKFNDTYQDVEDETKWLATWHQARFTLEYLKKPPLAPPLNILLLPCYVFQILKCIRAKCEKEEYTNVKSADKNDNTSEWQQWERCMAEVYLLSNETENESDYSRSAEFKTWETHINPQERHVNKQLSRVLGAVEELTKRLDHVESKQSHPVMK